MWLDKEITYLHRSKLFLQVSLHLQVNYKEMMQIQIRLKLHFNGLPPLMMVVHQYLITQLSGIWVGPLLQLQKATKLHTI
jgi:hypothetical protein